MPRRIGTCHGEEALALQVIVLGSRCRGTGVGSVRGGGRRCCGGGVMGMALDLEERELVLGALGSGREETAKADEDVEFCRVEEAAVEGFGESILVFLYRTAAVVIESAR